MSILLNEDGFINYDIDPNVQLVNFRGIFVLELLFKIDQKLRDYIEDRDCIAPLTNIMIRLATIDLNEKIVFYDHITV